MLHLSDSGDKLLPALLDFFLCHTRHGIDPLQDSVYVLPARLDANAVSPADLKTTDCSAVVLPNVKEPVEDVIIVFGVQDDFIPTVEDFSCLVVDDATCPEEARVGIFGPSTFSIVDETFLTGIGDPVSGRSEVVVVLRLSRKA